MPLHPDMRRAIDQVRDDLFGGGYPDPVSNAEQLSFLFFFYLVKGIDAENRARARFLKKPYTSLFDGTWELKNPLNATAGVAVQDAQEVLACRGVLSAWKSSELGRVYAMPCPRSNGGSL